MKTLERGPGWKLRHLAVLVAATAATLAFEESRAEWLAMHRWNRAFGDASVLLISLSMAIGPMTRLWPRVRVLIPWRREMGIWGVVLAAVHTAIILDGWVEWDLIRIFGFQPHPMTGEYVMLQHGLGFANAVGIVALVYGAILAASSNDRSQRFLGGAIWKFLQQSAYVLWALIVLHTAYFLYLHFQDFHRPVPEPNWIQWPFAALVVAVALLQGAAFWTTWFANRRKRARSKEVANRRTESSAV